MAGREARDGRRQARRMQPGEELAHRAHRRRAAVDDPVVGLDDRLPAAGAEEMRREAQAEGRPGMGADVARVAAPRLVERIAARHQHHVPAPAHAPAAARPLRATSRATRSISSSRSVGPEGRYSPLRQSSSATG